MNAAIKFWSWFTKNIKSIEQLNSNPSWIDQIDQQVRTLGNFSWEVGPGLMKKFAFVLSPSGNRQLLLKTKEIVENAPEHMEWEWHYCKPPKNFEFIVEIPHGSNNIVVDGSNWHVGMLKYPDGKIELDVKADNLQGFPEEFKIKAVDIMIVGVIGEENYIEYLDTINVVNGFEERLKKASFNIVELKDRIEYEINNRFN